MGDNTRGIRAQKVGGYGTRIKKQKNKILRAGQKEILTFKNNDDLLDDCLRSDNFDYRVLFVGGKWQFI